ncbi:MAG: glutathione S-transferase family protein [Candidatus Omnitrophica bacterium]|nr:glutathione S-transferase family protein [Candidatus Omnitrophota bacterium]MDE2221448.1 glutathione S-transferase family protein [Candidatus Omnitrophota bacterium]
MIKLYGSGVSSSVAKVRYCLNLLNLKYDWVETNPMNGENKTPEYLSVSPTGKIPGIDIDGFKLFESNAINRYLALTHGSALYPQDAKKQAVVDAWTDYVAIHVAQAMGRVTYNRVFAPMMAQKADEESLRVGLDFLDKYFPVLEKQLSQNQFLAGSQLSLADINLLANIDWVELAQISLEKYPSIKKWRAALKSQPFYQQCYKDYTDYVQEAMGARAQAK